MNTAKTLFATAVVATTFAVAAHAQEPVFQLPDQCNVVPAMVRWTIAPWAMVPCMATSPAAWGRHDGDDGHGRCRS